jgi:hypothetical protein
MTIEQKCVEILQAGVNHANKRPTDVLGFSMDWGGYTLTVTTGNMHTHVGPIQPEGTFEELVNDLHNLLVKENGLSWA